MVTLSNHAILFVASAFLFQAVLIVHFALRKWRFDTAMRYGPIVYALCVPAAAVSALLILLGKSWAFWSAGFTYLIWAAFGYTVDFAWRIQWRSPIRWPIFGPYVGLYLAAVLFYWWPLALISNALWYAYAVLFIASTLLNVTSHNPGAKRTQAE